MISTPASPRGQPLLVLFVLLGGWVALRAALWESPFPPMPADREAEKAAAQTVPAALPDNRAPEGPALHGGTTPGPSVAAPPVPLASPWLVMPALDDAAPADEEVSSQPADLPSSDLAFLAPSSRPAAAFVDASARAVPKPSAVSGGPLRWSADSWLLLRRDSDSALAAGAPSYGRSQAGAVLRYRLAPASGHRPVLYARATRALAGRAETEVAAGFAARPVAGVPVSVAGEMRVHEGPGRRELRPAAFAVTVLPPAKLPLGLRGELYAQTGYVGGRFATAFVDGQMRVDRELARVGRTGELRAGAGMWGGAQKHSSRLDVGPSVTFGFALGPTQSRLAIDYRWRVVGNAEPENGPALTISAGF